MAYTTPNSFARGLVLTHTILNASLANLTSIRASLDARTMVYRTSNESVSTSTDEVINWQAEITSTDLWDAGNPDRLVATVDGWYRLYVCHHWSPDVDDSFRRVHYRRGTDTRQYELSHIARNIGGIETTDWGADDVHLDAGEYVRLFVTQNSGGNVDLVGGSQFLTRAVLRLVARDDTPATEGWVWREPKTFTTGLKWMPWEARDDLRDNVELLALGREAYIRQVNLAGNDQSVRGLQGGQPVIFRDTTWNHGGMRSEQDETDRKELATYTIQVTGLYEFLFTAEWRPDQIAIGNREIVLKINDDEGRIGRINSAVVDGNTTQSCYWVVPMTAGDTYQFLARHTSNFAATPGGQDEVYLNSGGPGDATRFSVHMIGGLGNEPPAWTTPTAWASTNVPTAAQLNAQIRDNLLHLRSPQLAIIKKTSDQSIAVSTNTTVTFDEALNDNTAGMWTSGTPNRITAVADGWFIAAACVKWEADNDGCRGAWFRISGGSSYLACMERRLGTDTESQYQLLYAEFPLTAGQYVELRAFQDGEATGLDIRRSRTEMALVRIGA